MKTPMALSVTSSQREQTSLRFQVPRLPRSNVCSTRDLENPSASVHLKRFSTPSLTLRFLCAGKLNPRFILLSQIRDYVSQLSLADSLSMLFGSYGIERVGAGDGDGAIARLEGGFRPDVVMSDYRLPKENGLVAVARLRSALGYTVPVIMILGIHRWAILNYRMLTI